MLFLITLLGDYTDYDAGCEDKYRNNRQLVQAFIGAAADRVNFAGAAQAGAQTGTASLDQNKDGQQNGTADCDVIPNTHLYILQYTGN
jgi:hypothetical protein